MPWKIESPTTVHPVTGAVEVHVWITTPEGVLVDLSPAAVRLVVITSDSPVPSPMVQARLTLGSLQVDMPRATAAELVEACKKAEAANQ